MSSLRCLRDADVPFKGISIAHDMTPWQRDEIRRLVQQAKQEHVSSSSEPAENFWFRVARWYTLVYHTPLCINASVESAETATKHSYPGCRVKCDSNRMYTKNTFNCICFNARSLRNKMSDLMALVGALNPDVIGITKSWGEWGYCWLGI